MRTPPGKCPAIGPPGALGRWLRSSYLRRYLFFNGVGVNDYRLFPGRSIDTAPPCFAFTPDTGSEAAIGSILGAFGSNALGGDPAGRFLDATGTAALLVVRGDRLLAEHYGRGYDRASIVTSFSVAKSVVSALVGIALGERLIRTLDDSITRYLPDLRGSHWSAITIRHLVTMRSGLRYNDRGFLPWNDQPRVYYALDLRQLARRAQYGEPPGRHFRYNNYNVVLLGMILERAATAPVSQYLQERIWKPLGMEFPASWSLDSESSGMEKMESGLNARAIDFVKFGRLYLERGCWRGRQIVPEAWVAESTAKQPGRRAPYAYLWWLPTEGRYMAVGNLAQFIYVAPDRNVVVARFGRGRPRNWRAFYPRVFASLVDAV